MNSSNDMAAYVARGFVDSHRLGQKQSAKQSKLTLGVIAP